MTEADKKLVINLWNAGTKIYQIVRMLPYNEKTAMSIIKELRENGTLTPRASKEENVKAVCEAYLNGEHNIEKLSKMFKITVASVRTYLLMGGVKRERPKHYICTKEKSEKTLAIIEELNKGEKSQVEIAKEYGVTRQYVNGLKKGFLSNEGV